MADRFADFNPRAPCGARRNLSAIGGGGQGFQSTRPVWGATLRLPVPRLPCRFQSTRPRGARPLPPLNLAHQHRPFQSTRPRGARLSFPNARCLSLQFQSTRPQEMHVITNPQNCRQKAPAAECNRSAAGAFIVCRLRLDRRRERLIKHRFDQPHRSLHHAR